MTLAGAGAIGAQVNPLGVELQVNTFTTGAQYDSAVAADAQGDFVVVWMSAGSVGTDASGYSIQGRRYDANGTPLGGQFQVNSYSTGDQKYPAVTMDSVGNFLVVWASYGSSATDTNSASVQAQRFDAAGSPVAGQFQVNGYTTSFQTQPAAVLDDQGQFVIVWASAGSTGNDSSYFSVQGRRYDTNGTPLAAEFQINSFTTSFQQDPAVAWGSQGGFVVAWSSIGASGSGNEYGSIQGQLYAANGSPAGGQFQVNTFTPNGQYDPSMASDAQGNFVIVWDSSGSSGSDTSGTSVQARRYLANGTPIGADFQVNSYTTFAQMEPSVASDAAGNFVVTWASDAAAGSDQSGSSIQAQRFASNGSLRGGQFQVNTYTTGGQYRAQVADGGHGNFVLAWDGNGSGFSDTSDFSIHAQRFGCLFCDDFESADAGNWSVAVP